MNLQSLIISLKSTPSLLPHIEKEVLRLTETEDNSELILLKDGSVEDQLYFLIILEQKIKYFKKRSRSDVILTLIHLLDFYPKFHIKKFSYIYALLGLYEFPNNFSQFFNNVVQLISTNDPLGPMILSDFLFLVEYSTDIDGKRRGELTKANKVIASHYLPHIYNQLKEPNTILLSIIEYNYPINYQILLNLPYHEKLIEIINPLLHNQKYIISFLNYIQNIPLILSTVIELTRTNLISEDNINLVFNYILRATEEKNIIFYSILFIKKNKKYINNNKYNIILYLIESYYKYNNIKTNENINANTQEITFNNYILEIIKYFVENQSLEDINDTFRIKNIIKEYKIPKKISMCILDGINKKIKGSKLYSNTEDINMLNNYKNISFPYNDYFLDCYFLAINIFREAMNYMAMLKTEDIEDKRLIIRIIDNYSFSKEEYEKLLEFYKDEEISSRIYIKNGVKINFNFNRDTELFYFYIKNKGEIDENTVNEFYNYFINNFNYSLMKIIGVLLKNNIFKREDILEQMVENLDISGISIFIKEILNNFTCEIKENKYIFKMKIVDKISIKIMNDWEREEDISYIIKYIDIIIKEYDRNKRTYDGSVYINEEGNNINERWCTLVIKILIKFLKIEEIDVLHMIIVFFNKNRISSREIVEQLMVWYRSSYDSLHSMIITNIIISGLLNDRIEEMENKSHKKVKIMVREYLKEYKGKALSELFRSESKVREQGIWNVTEKKEEFDIELE